MIDLPPLKLSLEKGSGALKLNAFEKMKKRGEEDR